MSLGQALGLFVREEGWGVVLGMHFLASCYETPEMTICCWIGLARGNSIARLISL